MRTAAAISTLAVSLFYLLAQMAGAGGLVALLLGVTSSTGQTIVIAVVGVLMIFYVLVGGMKGTTWVQIIKAVLLIAGAGADDAVGAGQVRLQPLRPARRRRGEQRARRRRARARACKYGASTTTKLDFISLAIALVLGTAGLPHVLMRFYTVPTAKEARRSVVWAIGLIGAFYLFTLVLGYGAAALVGAEEPSSPHPARPTRPPRCWPTSSAAPVLLGLISAVAFATILAVVAGLTITASRVVRPRHLRATSSRRASRPRTTRSRSPASPRS